MRSFEQTVLAFDRACAASGVPYALIGGMAVNAWGQPRNTTDIDALVDLESARIDKFLEALTREGLRTTRFDLESALADRSHVTVFDPEGEIHVDVKLAGMSDERDQVKASVALPFEHGSVSIARPEDTVAYKLKFGSPRDLADARSIVLRQGPRLDRERLERIAARLRVVPALRALLDEVDRP